MSETNVNDTDWSPERKIVGAAVAVVLLALLQVFTSYDIPVGVEGALAVLASYFIPNTK